MKTFFKRRHKHCHTLIYQVLAKPLKARALKEREGWAPAVQWLRDLLERPDQPEKKLRDNREAQGDKGDRETLGMMIQARDNKGED